MNSWTKLLQSLVADRRRLMAAEVIRARGVIVDVYDAMPSVGRKFLMAGRGGLNLTYSEQFEKFISRYGNRGRADIC
jgi:predicted flavoprotein YhiN